MKLLTIPAVLLFAVLPLFADSVTFSTAAFPSGVPLGPGLDPLLIASPIDPSLHVLGFATSFGPIGTAVFSATLNLPGLQHTLGPFMDQCSDTTCIEVYGFQVPITYKVVPGTLSVTLNGVTETYDFRYQSPVPEPTSFLFLGTGLAGIAWRRYQAAKH
jgi:hypothetical protein